MEYIEVSKLVPAEYNPRKISPSQMENLKMKIQKDRAFFEKRPCLVNKREGKLIVYAGNQRLKAAQELGWDRVPCDLDEIPIELEKERNVNDNKSSGDWEYDLLADFDEEMLKYSGFEEWELDKIFKKGVQEDDFDAQDQYDKIAEPEAKRGDIYQLGKHRIMCGDSTSEDDFKTLMGGVLGNLVFTDPPYAVDYHSPDGMTYSSKKYGGSGGKIFNDDKNDEEARSFFSKVLGVLFGVTTDDVSIYWWFATKRDKANVEAFVEAGWHRSQTIIWVKNSMIFSRMYEPCLFGWKKGKKHYTNKNIVDLKNVFALEYDDFKQAFDSFIDVWYQKRDSTTKYLHPTQKPIKLAERGLKKNSKERDVIIDAFLGSGSTLMACEQMSRICYGMELDPKFIDVIIKRWELFTGKKAVKVV